MDNNIAVYHLTRSFLSWTIRRVEIGINAQFFETVQQPRVVSYPVNQLITFFKITKLSGWVSVGSNTKFLGKYINLQVHKYNSTYVNYLLALQ